MAQRRRQTRGASRQRDSQDSAAALRWYGAGVASGLFLAFLVYLITLPPDASTPEQVPAPGRVAAVPAPEYEFYDVLPSQEITVDVDPAELPDSRSASPAKQYLLQAGSFREAADADRRRAELLLLGLEPRVEETRGDTGRWYRVVIGHFESRSAMAQARSLTAQQDIDTLLIQRKAG